MSPHIMPGGFVSTEQKEKAQTREEKERLKGKETQFGRIIGSGSKNPMCTCGHVHGVGKCSDCDCDSFFEKRTQVRDAP